MQNDPFEKYYREGEPSQRDLGYAWQTGVGLQAVDGLQPSDYLINMAKDNIEGRITLDRANELIESYYRENPVQPQDRTEEADKVAARIAQILSERSFVFSPAYYLSIHHRLFTGIYYHAGKIRDYNITKKEWVLDGDTVLYGGASELQATLDYDFGQEKDFSYKGLSMDATIHHLALFISRLWQIHVFGEGNTRTTAVFFIQYLRSLGFDVTNDTFAENAWYFRNAMVRANYNDLQRGIHETTEYMELFLRNLLLHENHKLHNRYMHISGAFQEQDIEKAKQDIDGIKQDIQTGKQDIDPEFPYEDALKELDVSPKTILHVRKMFETYGFNQVFGRGEVAELLRITVSPASELVRKLLMQNIIVPVSGKGKGRYKFTAVK